jgi:hypothetical protein
MTALDTGSQRAHLHADDYPVTLRVLDEVLRATQAGRARLAEIGYEATEHGVWVDWDALERSWLSSTERAAVIVTRGIAAAERQGGWPPRLRGVLTDAVGAL